MLKFIAGSFISLCVFASSSFANEASSLTDKEKIALTDKLISTIGLNVISIKDAPLPNLVELVTNQGLFYASKDGHFLMQGKLYGIEPEGIVNYTEDSLAVMRVEGLKQFSEGVISYPAKNEKHVLSVFTDITCSYCRQMHKEMDQLNELGITVNYLAYPRSGVKDQFGQLSQGYKDLRSLWCHEKPAEALTKAKLGSSVAQRICESPVEAQFDFGRQIGVNSTPTIIFENGLMLPGYRKPNDLIQILDSLKAQS